MTGGHLWTPFFLATIAIGLLSTSVQTNSTKACITWSALVEDGARKADKPENDLLPNGEFARPKEFPHMGAVGFSDNPTKWLCGCTLISEKFVLSSAVCSAGTRTYGRAKWVRLGELDFSTEADDARPFTYGVKRIITHPQYTSGQYYNDIALMELDKTVTFNDYVRPACLHTKWETEADELIATGWGYLEFRGKKSELLKKIMLNLKSLSTCISSYPIGSYPKRLPQGLNNETMLCAGGDGKDTCQGDAGGPLQYEMKDSNHLYSIVGIVSFGRGCDGKHPAVYTRVSSFVPWIDSVVWP